MNAIPVQKISRPFVAAILRYAKAILIVFLAMAISSAFESWTPHIYILFLLVASAISSWFCGRNPGIMAAALCTAALDYFELEPKHSFLLAPESISSLLFFSVCSAGAVMWLSSERRASQEAITQRETNLRTLLEGIRDYSIVLLDSEGHVKTWNSGAERMQGYTADEIIGKHFSVFYPPGEELLATQTLQDAERNGRAEQEGKRVRKDGTEFWANVVITPLFDRNDNLKGFSKVKRDISERKRTEAELEKQAIVTSIVESAPDAVIMVDDNASILLFNGQAEAMFGYSRNEVLGKSIEELVPAAKQQVHAQHRASYISQARTRMMGGGLDLYAQRKDGSVFPVEVSLSPIEHAGRTLVISSIRDISERKRLEKMVTVTQVVDLAQVMVREMNGTIVHWTTGAERLYGYTREDAIGAVSHSLLQTIFPEPLPQIEQRLNQTGQWEGELVHKKRDGSKIIVSSYWILYRDESGQPHRILESSTDITRLKEAERQVRKLNDQLEIRNERLEAANRLIASHTQQIANSAKMSALGEMAGGIAHEINNPIGIIYARANDLKELAEGTPALPAKTVIQAMESIGNLAQRVAKITKGMRRISREAAGDPFQKVSIAEILDDTLAFCKEKFRLRSVELRLPSPAVSCELECRVTEISQVLLNLLNNAMDAVDPLREKWVELGVTELPERVEITITDSGCGIAPEIREKLMQPFFTTKELGKGTGLGLSISRGIVESHGGLLTLDATNSNTCFRIVLPKAQNSAAAIAGLTTMQNTGN